MKQTKAERFLEAFNDIDEKFLKEAMNYNMKKKFNFKPIIAVAACAVFALAAIPAANHFANNDLVDGGTTAGTVAAVPGDEVEKIGANGNFTVYELGAHGGQQLGTHKIELELNGKQTEYIDTTKVGSRETLEWNGQTWTGKYTNSKTQTDFKNTIYEYEGVSNGKKVSFGIDSVTGKCEYFMFKTTEDIDKTFKLTREELYEIAYADFIAGEYTEDPENYMLVDEGNNGSAGYWFKFARLVNGIETSEYIRIGLRNNGDFYWYICNNIGDMKNVDASAIDIDKLYKAVEEKFKSIYENNYISFEREGIVLTKLRDGSYIFDCEIFADVKDANGEIVKDNCFFAITMD